MFTLSEKIQSNVAAFGEYQAAKLLARRVQFQAYYFARFNRYPSH